MVRGRLALLFVGCWGFLCLAKDAGAAAEHDARRLDAIGASTEAVIRTKSAHVTSSGCMAGSVSYTLTDGRTGRLPMARLTKTPPGF